MYGTVWHTRYRWTSGVLDVVVDFGNHFRINCTLKVFKETAPIEQDLNVDVSYKSSNEAWTSSM